MKIKTFYFYAEVFDEVVNKWFEKHPNITIVESRFGKGFVRNNDDPSTNRLQFYLFLIYKEHEDVSD